MAIEESLELDLAIEEPRAATWDQPLDGQLSTFNEFGRKTCIVQTVTLTSGGSRVVVPTYINEFWTSRQRAANALHEISYRACFKPQLPRFFIQRLCAPGDRVYDPFMGRGTTLVEAALLGRIPAGCDINPVSALLTRPRLNPPTLGEIRQRLDSTDLCFAETPPEDLLVFYHPETLREICGLRKYLLDRRRANAGDRTDDWIAMVALNRLTGHSPGFFSVYTLPPNQAVSVVSQRKINETRKQQPPRRNVREIIFKKSRQLLKECTPDNRATLNRVGRRAILLTAAAWNTSEIPASTVSLVVTSPPFLDVVDYAGDNWLRCWFAGIDPNTVNVTRSNKLAQWQAEMTRVFAELHRVLRPGGHVAFEVGEVRGGTIRLEEAVIPCGIEAGFQPLLVLINDQQFTKTANCWGVDNNAKGTNTNRVVVFRK